ncbi:MAG: hypothetical protein HZA48_11655 [Planctomycetes bacterium]|nr:hypothetical protein [Planctomycetota bacterium]
MVALCELPFVYDYVCIGYILLVIPTKAYKRFGVFSVFTLYQISVQGSVVYSVRSTTNDDGTTAKIAKYAKTTTSNICVRDYPPKIKFCRKIITIGMKEQYVLKELGRPYETRNDGPLVSWEYYLEQYGPAIDCEGLLLIFDENERVVDFRTVQH